MDVLNFRESREDMVRASASRKDLGFAPRHIWSPVPGEGHRIRPYSVPQEIRIGTRNTKQASAKFTPGPFAVGVISGQGKAIIAVRADPSWHLWNMVSFKANSEHVEVSIDLEGHNDPTAILPHIDLCILHGEDEEPLYSLLRRALKATYPEAYSQMGNNSIPDWWKRPIYCGWGDQVGISLSLEGPGPEPRALAYCIQGLYERWIKILESANVPVGTVIIDAGWSSGGVWEPNLTQWPDLKGFIETQHRESRRVLLWIPTWFCENLPDKWCIFSGNTKLVVDPTNPEYRAFLRRQVEHLLSPEEDGLDADGFKIDQLRYTPNERQLSGGEHFGRSFELGSDHPPMNFNEGRWGCELLYQLQKDIYRAAKEAKHDSLITSSTVHPYFHDTFDMVRLHDTGPVPEDGVMSAMRPRCQLSRAVFPWKPIDSDDWVHHDYGEWLAYTLNNHQLGVPCTLYAENFVCSFGRKPLTQPIKTRDLKRITGVWNGYLAKEGMAP